MTTSKYNFLIADDIIMNRFLLREIISEIANEIYEAGSGREAVDLLRENPIDIVLMDIEMPEMNGVETTQYIRKKMNHPLSGIPVIALTAHNPADFFTSHQSAGFDQLITKPYSIDKIMRVISSLNDLPKSR
ncbi:MAG: response regulator [Bacteroidales bacterium]|nr:response regulator [Bacteroidales bacterium]